MALKQLLTEYNWLISALIVIVGEPAFSYLNSGQILTWQGFLSVIVAAGLNYYTTHVGKQAGAAQMAEALTNGTVKNEPVIHTDN